MADDTRDRARSTGGSRRRAAAARLPRARPDRARRRDRLRRARVGRELPIGWTDAQDAGRYRLERRDDEARFGYAVGPHSWKQFLFPPRLRLWQASAGTATALRGRGGADRRDRRSRFLGVRSCELHAIAIQDRVLHRRQRTSTATTRPGAKDAFIVAVNCFEPGGTCFCVSMGTGPEGASAGYDLALTEILDGEHRFLVEAAASAARGPRRAAGAGAATQPTSRPPAPPSTGAAAQDGPRSSTRPTCTAARAQPRAPALGRRRRALPDLRQLHDGLPDLLLHERRGHRPTSPASTPSACALWDSCFSVDYSYIHGGSDPALRPLALPPVADAQVRHLARPVRHAPAASAAAAASPGARSGST